MKYDTNGNGTVEDETILWRVLRDDSDKVELISANVLGIGEDGIEPVDLKPTDFNDARNKYNGAVQTIVQKCIDITGISSVRSIGGPATDTTTTTVDFEELKRTTDFTPSVDISEFDKYEGKNGFKVGDDTYYLEDRNQMQRAAVLQADNSKDYWMASRRLRVTSSTMVVFCVRCCSNVDVFEAYLGGIHDHADNSFDLGYTWKKGVRPVLTLEGGILEGKTGAGTKEQPIEIYQNT